MLNIAVVEDEINVSKQIESYINSFANEHRIEISITVYNNADDFLSYYKNNFDLVFMDIELPGINGMDATIKLREKIKML